mgnify:CR=1 FL=1
MAVFDEIWVERATQAIENIIERQNISIDAATDEYLKDPYINFTEEMIQDVNYVRTTLKEISQIRSLTNARVLTKGRQEEWYLSHKENQDFNWFAYEKYLVERGWAKEDIESIDISSTKVVNQIINPKFRASKRFIGLVLGYVQSGKTSNMAATIAKAADRGYKLIIILAGMTKALRKQTQSRIIKDITTHREDLWHLETSTEDDFVSKNAIPIFINQKKTTLLVVKKNVPVLRRLDRSIAKIEEVSRSTIPTLIIDDECDQASPNSQAYRENVSATNRIIRDILDKFKKVTYVGYTATPYANILTPQTEVDSRKSLYPNEFIVSLKEPKRYFGARKLFGDDNNIEEGNELPFIRRVFENEVENLQPRRRNERFEFERGDEYQIQGKTNSMQEFVKHIKNLPEEIGSIKVTNSTLSFTDSSHDVEFKKRFTSADKAKVIRILRDLSIEFKKKKDPVYEYELRSFYGTLGKRTPAENNYYITMRTKAKDDFGAAMSRGDHGPLD